LSRVGEGPADPQRLSTGTDQSDYYRNLLQDVFEVIRSDQYSLQELLQMIRNRLPLHQIRVYLDRVLPDAHLNEEPSKKAKQIHDIPTKKDEPQFRSQTMDISYLCQFAPFRVPAKPWTNVTDDDDLVSHLVSLYMTWDYPFHAFFDRKSFLEDMQKGNLNSDFCSPFLVNALLANACVGTNLIYFCYNIDGLNMTGLLTICRNLHHSRRRKYEGCCFLSRSRELHEYTYI
jgi:hypothetical protein